MENDPEIQVAEAQVEAFSIDALPHAFGGPVGCGRIRVEAADFHVEELLPFEPEGKGEHLWLLIEKEGENTADVALRLANLAGVRRMDIGYAGLKDRNAVTTQWFSIYLPGRDDPDFSNKLPPSIRILRLVRHGKKLRRGVLAGNRFKILVRDFKLLPGQGHDALTKTLELIRVRGYPNYFGEQRFGHDQGNLRRAIGVLTRGKTRKAKEGIYLSAVRSMLFNLVLAKRVEAGTWDRAMEGDVMQISGSNSLFVSETIEGAIVQRLVDHNIQPTAPLPGRAARIAPVSRTAALENSLLDDYAFWVEGLVRCRVDADRRATRATASEFSWEVDGDTLVLEFALPKGSYATSLLREVVRDQEKPD